MDYTKLDDVTLVRLIHHKNSGALSVLYDRYAGLVFSLALNMVGDGSVAEEITQDVFLNVWNGAGSYRSGQAQVNTWLTSIARHRAIDMLRRHGSRAEQHTVSWAEPDLDLVSNEDGPQETVARMLEQERVRQAVAQLPAEQREALALAYFKGYTQQQIADTLNQPLGTVKTRIRLAMRKLRETLLEPVPD